MINLNDIREFITNTPGNIVGTLDRPESIPSDILEKIPHRYTCDLVIQYWLEVEDDDKIMRMLIDNDLARYLGYTEGYLYYHACKNIGKPVVQKLLDTMKRIMVSLIDINDAGVNLYIITNSKMRFGSFYLCMPDVLGGIADEYMSDLIVIPSSKHELLFLNHDEINIPICGIKQMVHFVNRTEVKPKDVLSDNVYIWDREKKKLIVY